MRVQTGFLAPPPAVSTRPVDWRPTRPAGRSRAPRCGPGFQQAVQELGVVGRARRQAWRQRGIVDREAFAGARQGKVIEQAGNGGVDFFAQRGKRAVVEDCRSTAPPALEAPPASQRVPNQCE